jgi:hypothetical protein
LDRDDAWSQYGDKNFKSVCDLHDLCYHGPWEDIRQGFDTCNDNFWNDMGDIFSKKPFWETVHCYTIRSAWGIG